MAGGPAALHNKGNRRAGFEWPAEIARPRPPRPAGCNPFRFQPVASHPADRPGNIAEVPFPEGLPG